LSLPARHDWGAAAHGSGARLKAKAGVHFRMNHQPTATAGPPGASSAHADAPQTALGRAWQSIRGRILGGLLFVLPILITLWVIYWIYSTLEKYVIDPLALFVLWKVRGGQADVDLPYWFETYAAPPIAILFALVLLYCMGFFVRSRLQWAVDWVLLRVPVFSMVYNGVRNVFKALEKQPGQQGQQRVVLVAFPHPGMKVPAFVTATCRDIETQKAVLCVYVPTAPVPTSGYFLLVPEDEVTELNWTSEQAVQAIISAGLTAPSQVAYFKSGRPAVAGPKAAATASPAETDPRH
jgi:uncharacterized membrane protein